MIVGIGHDAVAIARFVNWHTYSYKKLRRIFSEQEIAYCLQEPSKSAERFAARFASKEALYKALCQAEHKLPFLTLCASSEVISTNHGPQIRLYPPLPAIKTNLSITHTDLYAYSILIISIS